MYIYKIEWGTDFLVVGCVSKGAISSIAFGWMSNSSQCTESDNGEFTVVPSITSHLASAPFATPRHLCKIRTSPLEGRRVQSHCDLEVSGASIRKIPIPRLVPWWTDSHRLYQVVHETLLIPDSDLKCPNSLFPPHIASSVALGREYMFLPSHRIFTFSPLVWTLTFTIH